MPAEFALRSVTAVPGADAVKADMPHFDSDQILRVGRTR